jgi:hypothetical protein
MSNISLDQTAPVGAGPSSVSGVGVATLPQPQLARRRKPRLSKDPKNILAPSIFRPHVLARDRVFAWLSPHSLAARAALRATVPASHIDRLEEVFVSAVVKKTRENWGAGLLRFHQYCDSVHIPETERVPASERLLCLFVANCGAGKVSESCISGWLAGIHRYHVIHGAPWHGSEALSLVKRGAANLTPAESKRPRRQPVTRQHLLILRENLNLGNAFDAAVYATATTAFWACCRLIELVVPSRHSFDPIYHVARTTGISRGVARQGRRFTTFHIPYSKTQRHSGEDIHLIEVDDPTSPVIAFEQHMLCNARVPASAPLFAFETADGGWAPMTRDWFLNRCNEVWARAGLGTLQGHGFRIGGTTHMLMLGIDPWIVMVIGRWSSSAFLLYWRKVEQILPDFMGEAFESAASLTARMSIVCRSLQSF